jgi:hypothetical protein
VRELLIAFRRFFEICRSQNFKLHALNCDLFCKEAEWCGRKISKEGIKFNPKHLSGLIVASSPTNGAELQQFLCASNWMRTAIPKYAELSDPLLRLSRQCQDDIGSSKQKLALYRLCKLWDAAVEMQFVQLRDAIVKKVTLSHPDSAQALCLHTDASQEFYAAVLTTMPVEDLEKHVDEQRHEPLAFVSGLFVISSCNWSVPGKEAFAIVAAMTKLRYLTLVRKVHVHTDHRNLVYIFDPRSTNPSELCRVKAQPLGSGTVRIRL